MLNRVSEDGILPHWFRQPHRRFGTSYRILNLVVALQLVTILLSGGNIFVLGEAYAFGVMWSFAMKGLAVLVLRYKQPGKREFRVPLNPKIAGVEIPIGLGLITLMLVALCVINLLTKQVATIAGVSFTLIFFAIFEISEWKTRKTASAHAELDQFNLETGEDLTPGKLGVRPGNVLVMVRNYNTLSNLKRRSGSRRYAQAGCGRPAPAVSATLGFGGVRARAGAALQPGGADAVHAGPRAVGEKGQADSPGGGGRHREVGCHSARRAEPAVVRSGARRVAKLARGRRCTTGRPGVGAPR